MRARLPGWPRRSPAFVRCPAIWPVPSGPKTRRKVLQRPHMPARSINRTVAASKPPRIVGARQGLAPSIGRGGARRRCALRDGSPPSSLAWLGHRFLHLGVSRGDLGVHPRCSDTSSAFEKESRSAAMFLLAYGRSTYAELASRVDTKVSHDDAVSRTESQQPKRRCS